MTFPFSIRASEICLTTNAAAPCSTVPETFRLALLHLISSWAFHPCFQYTAGGLGMFYRFSLGRPPCERLLFVLFFSFFCFFSESRKGVLAPASAMSSALCPVWSLFSTQGTLALLGDHSRQRGTGEGDRPELCRSWPIQLWRARKFFFCFTGGWERRNLRARPPLRTASRISFLSPVG